MLFNTIGKSEGDINPSMARELARSAYVPTDWQPGEGTDLATAIDVRHGILLITMTLGCGAQAAR